MIIDIPKNNKITIGNNGNIHGSINATFNLDLSEDNGKMTLSRKLLKTTDTGDGAGLTTAHSFVVFDGYYFALAGGTVYKNSTTAPLSSFEVDSSTGTPTGLDGDVDIIIFNDVPYIIGDTIYKKNGNLHTDDWVSVSTSPDAGFHSTATYIQRLYYSNLGDRVNSLNTSDSVSTSGDYTLDLKRNDLQITSVRSSSDGIWVATTNIAGGRAVVYKWDGVTENTTNASYRIPDVSVRSLVIYKDRPYIITGKGLLMSFNGAFFEEVTRFPFYKKERIGLQDAARKTVWTYDNCISVIDDEIHITVNAASFDSSSDINNDARAYSGVWVFLDNIGLHHKYAFTTTDQQSNTIGACVEIAEVGAIYPGALTQNITQWEDAIKFITSAKFYTSATATDYGIYALPEKYSEGSDNSYIAYQNISWLLTSQIQASEITESWGDLIITFKHLANSTDKIVCKARTNESDFIDSTITWTSTTTFTSTDSEWATIKSNYDSGTGYESTIIRGKGSGMCSHITDISKSGGTYTVTLDETHVGATSGTAKARIEKWVKLGEITDTLSILNYKRFSIGGDDSTWIQFKIFLLGKGTSPTIERIISKSETKKQF